MPEIDCRVCEWTGRPEELLKHCQLFHPEIVREHNNRSCYDFELDELLTHEAMLLTGSQDNIYWFCLDPTRYDLVKLGIFHIAGSTPFEYSIKLGLARAGHKDFMGPFRTQPEGFEPDEQFDVEITYCELKFWNKTIPSRHVRFFVGKCEEYEEEPYIPSSEELAWLPGDEALNKQCVEKFTCTICMDYIRKDVRFCKNKHFVCLGCFDEMRDHRTLRCPLCRVGYSYDCFHEELERFLEKIKFPKDQEGEEDKADAATQTDEADLGEGSSTKNT